MDGICKKSYKSLMRTVTKISQSKSWINRRFLQLIIIGLLGSLFVLLISDYRFLILLIFPPSPANYRKRPECTCLRPALPSFPLLSLSETERNRSSLCSEYASRRGSNQRIISISLFGPKEARRFVLHQTLSYLELLLKDINTIYADGFILRIHHDTTINVTDIICPIECAHPNVDFCDMKDKLYIPPKIWRFIPAGDPLVDISK